MNGDGDDRRDYWRAEKKRKVGYKQPPEAHRFIKGRSGNPHGRPSKSHVAPRSVSAFALDNATVEELTRPIRFQANGGVQEAPAHTMITRVRANAALKGDRVAADNVHRELRDASERVAAEKQRSCLFWTKYVLDYARYSGRGHLEGQASPFPHPDDILINAVDHSIAFAGPVCEQDRPFFNLAHPTVRLALVQAQRRIASTRQLDDPVAQLFLAYAVLAYWALSPGLGGPGAQNAARSPVHRLTALLVDYCRFDAKSSAAKRQELMQRARQIEGEVRRLQMPVQRSSQKAKYALKVMLPGQQKVRRQR